jgi:cyclopropane-fatty-acyl-phospholipid synthase
MSNEQGATTNVGLHTDFASVQAHYDLSDEFFALFLDASMTYTCAMFDGPHMSLEQAQLAKIDHTLAKLGLRDGHVLLEVGCGWGATALRARELCRTRVIALTLSQNQYQYATRIATQRGATDVEFRLQGWETFDEPVDRIVSIGAMEHFGVAKYPAFFQKCHHLLPEAGVLVLHLITLGKPSSSFAFLRFRHFLSKRIFPNAFAPPPEVVVEQARRQRFELLHVESLRPHYARTLDCWATNLVANRDHAIAITSRETYDTYIKYLTTCAGYFRSGEVNLHQFTFRKTM